jgi:excisionase family DNA binding protein
VEPSDDWARVRELRRGSAHWGSRGEGVVVRFAKPIGPPRAQQYEEDKTLTFRLESDLLDLLRLLAKIVRASVREECRVAVADALAQSVSTKVGKSAPSDSLTVAEAAEILQHTEATVRRWIASRRLPAVRVGRRYILRRSDVEARLHQDAPKESCAHEDLEESAKAFVRGLKPKS